MRPSTPTRPHAPPPRAASTPPMHPFTLAPMHPCTHAPMQVGSWILTYMTGSFLAAFSLGCFATWLGAFGHNWVHQPRYKLWV